MKIWLECQSEAEAQFLVDLVLDGYFGCPLAAAISPVNPCSVNINLHGFRLTDGEIRRIPFVTKSGPYDDGLYSAELSPLEATQLEMRQTAKPITSPDIRRGLIARFPNLTAS